MDIDSYLSYFGFPQLTDEMKDILGDTDQSNIDKSKALHLMFAMVNYQIYTRSHNNTIIISYPTRHSSKITQLSDPNGIIFDIDTRKLICVPLRQMLSKTSASKACIPAELDLSAVYHAIDGTRITLYYSGESISRPQSTIVADCGTHSPSTMKDCYNNLALDANAFNAELINAPETILKSSKYDEYMHGWAISTEHSPDARNLTMLGEDSLGQIVMNCLRRAKVKIQSLDRTCSYTLMLQHREWNLSYNEKTPRLTFINCTKIDTKMLLFMYDAPPALSKLETLTKFEFGGGIGAKSANINKVRQHKVTQIDEYIARHMNDPADYGVFIFNKAPVNLDHGKSEMDMARILNHRIETHTMQVLTQYVYVPMYTYKKLSELAVNALIRCNPSDLILLRQSSPQLAPYIDSAKKLFDMIFSILQNSDIIFKQLLTYYMPLLTDDHINGAAYEFDTETSIDAIYLEMHKYGCKDIKTNYQCFVIFMVYKLQKHPILKDISPVNIINVCKSMELYPLYMMFMPHILDIIHKQGGADILNMAANTFDN
jgi:hypothetical protein